MANKADTGLITPIDDPTPTVCPVCEGIDSPHPAHEPSPKLGSSWWKRVGFNAPNSCAVAIRRAEIAFQQTRGLIE
ncbi:MAG TPA: hypothetical protein EYN66_19295 [Myxococcales bacterium]|nr:hypothetical protein [Myxococcales bacterium]